MGPASYSTHTGPRQSRTRSLQLLSLLLGAIVYNFCQPGLTQLLLGSRRSLEVYPPPSFRSRLCLLRWPCHALTLGRRHTQARAHAYTHTRWLRRRSLGGRPAVRLRWGRSEQWLIDSTPTLPLARLGASEAPATPHQRKPRHPFAPQQHFLSLLRELIVVALASRR